MTKFVNIGLFISYALLVIFSAVYDKDFNHDIIPYTALAVGGADAAARHAATWEVLRRHIPPDQIDRFNPAGATPNAVDNPDYLDALLPFFAVKAGYVTLVRLLSLAVDPVVAIQFLSLSSALLGMALVFLAFQNLSGVLRLAWLPVLGALDIDLLARTYTPDALNFGLYSLAFTLMLRHRLTPAIAVMIAASFVRPDGLVLNAMLAAPVFLASRPHGLLLALGSFACYLAATQAVGHPGWWSHFYFTFIDRQPHLAGISPPFDPTLYAKTVATRWAKLFVAGQWALPVALLLIVLHCRCHSTHQRLFFNVAVAAAAALLAKLAIFPFTLPRTSEPSIVALAFAVVAAISMAARGGPGRPT